ncbi:MAG TPA: RDD family protein [Ramlibacter sp.]|nr:RDD family protein [Ramlibacter sp.]
MPTNVSAAQATQATDGEPQLEYVGFWARVLAALVDTVMLVILTLPLTYFVYGQLSAPGSGMTQGPMDVLINWLLPAVIIVWLWMRLQATPGKMLLSARIVDADTGNTPTLTQFVIRYLGYFVSTIPFGLGLLWVAFDRRKQGWHDKIAHTVVVRPSRKNTVHFEKRAGSGERNPTL